MIKIDLEENSLDKVLEVEVEGWKPLTVNYSLASKSGISWLYWKISGTDHVFQIQYQIVIQHHGGILKDHFELVLKTFREDYKGWEKQNFPEEWMKKYQDMFQELIK